MQHMIHALPRIRRVQKFSLILCLLLLPFQCHSYTEVFSIARDSSDNTFQVGNRDSNFFISKKSPSCSLIWESTQGSTSGDDEEAVNAEVLFDVAVGFDGIVFAVGSTRGNFSSPSDEVPNLDAAVLVYDSSNGNLVRQKQYDIAADLDNVAQAVLQKQNGNILVAVHGSVPNIQSTATYETRILEIDSQTLEVQSIHEIDVTTTEDVFSVTGGPKLLDFIYEESSNSIVAVGFILGRGIIWKYSLESDTATNQAEWGRAFGNFQISGFTSDGNGAYFVVGSSSERVLGNTDIASTVSSEFHAYVIRYDNLDTTTTAATWVRQLAGVGSSQSGSDIAIDPVTGDIVVVGDFDADFSVTDSQTSETFFVNSVADDGITDVFVWYLEPLTGSFKELRASSVASTASEDRGNALSVLFTRTVQIAGITDDGNDDDSGVCDTTHTLTSPSPSPSPTPSSTPSLTPSSTPSSAMSPSSSVAPTGSKTPDVSRSSFPPPTSSIRVNPSPSVSSIGFETSFSISSLPAPSVSPTQFVLLLSSQSLSPNGLLARESGTDPLGTFSNAPAVSQIVIEPSTSFDTMSSSSSIAVATSLTSFESVEPSRENTEMAEPSKVLEAASATTAAPIRSPNFQLMTISMAFPSVTVSAVSAGTPEPSFFSRESMTSDTLDVLASSLPAAVDTPGASADTSPPASSSPVPQRMETQLTLRPEMELETSPTSDQQSDKASSVPALDDSIPTGEYTYSIDGSPDISNSDRVSSSHSFISRSQSPDSFLFSPIPFEEDATNRNPSPTFSFSVVIPQASSTLLPFASAEFVISDLTTISPFPSPISGETVQKDLLDGTLFPSSDLGSDDFESSLSASFIPSQGFLGMSMTSFTPSFASSLVLPSVETEPISSLGALYFPGKTPAVEESGLPELKGGRQTEVSLFPGPTGFSVGDALDSISPSEPFDNNIATVSPTPSIPGVEEPMEVSRFPLAEAFEEALPAPSREILFVSPVASLQGASVESSLAPLLSFSSINPGLQPTTEVLNSGLPTIEFKMGEPEESAPSKGFADLFLSSASQSFPRGTPNIFEDIGTPTPLGSFIFADNESIGFPVFTSFSSPTEPSRDPDDVQDAEKVIPTPLHPAMFISPSTNQAETEEPNPPPITGADFDDRTLPSAFAGEMKRMLPSPTGALEFDSFTASATVSQAAFFEEKDMPDLPFGETPSASMIVQEIRISNYPLSFEDLEMVETTNFPMFVGASVLPTQGAGRVEEMIISPTADELRNGGKTPAVTHLSSHTREVIESEDLELFLESREPDSGQFNAMDSSISPALKMNDFDDDNGSPAPTIFAIDDDAAKAETISPEIPLLTSELFAKTPTPAIDQRDDSNSFTSSSPETTLTHLGLIEETVQPSVSYTDQLISIEPSRVVLLIHSTPFVDPPRLSVGATVLPSVLVPPFETVMSGFTMDAAQLSELSFSPAVQLNESESAEPQKFPEASAVISALITFPTAETSLMQGSPENVILRTFDPVPLESGEVSPFTAVIPTVSEETAFSFLQDTTAGPESDNASEGTIIFSPNVVSSILGNDSLSQVPSESDEAPEFTVFSSLLPSVTSNEKKQSADPKHSFSTQSAEVTPYELESPNFDAAVSPSGKTPTPSSFTPSQTVSTTNIPREAFASFSPVASASTTPSPNPLLSDANFPGSPSVSSGRAGSASPTLDGVPLSINPVVSFIDIVIKSATPSSSPTNARGSNPFSPDVSGGIRTVSPLISFIDIVIPSATPSASPGSGREAISPVASEGTKANNTSSFTNIFFSSATPSAQSTSSKAGVPVSPPANPVVSFIDIIFTSATPSVSPSTSSMEASSRPIATGGTPTLRPGLSATTTPTIPTESQEFGRITPNGSFEEVAFSPEASNGLSDAIVVIIQSASPSPSGQPLVSSGVRPSSTAFDRFQSVTASPTKLFFDPTQVVESPSTSNTLIPVISQGIRVSDPPPISASPSGLVSSLPFLSKTPTLAISVAPGIAESSTSSENPGSPGSTNFPPFFIEPTNEQEKPGVTLEMFASEGPVVSQDTMRDGEGISISPFVIATIAEEAEISSIALAIPSLSLTMIPSLGPSTSSTSIVGSPSKSASPSVDCVVDGEALADQEALKETRNFQRVNMVIQVAGPNLTSSCQFTDVITERFILLSAANTLSQPDMWHITSIEDGPQILAEDSILVTIENINTEISNVTITPSPSNDTRRRVLFPGSVRFNVTTFMDPLSVELASGSYVEYVNSQNIVKVMTAEGFDDIKWTEMVVAPRVIDMRIREEAIENTAGGLSSGEISAFALGSILIVGVVGFVIAESSLRPGTSGPILPV